MKIKANYIQNGLISMLVSGLLFAAIMSIIDNNFSIEFIITTALLFGIPFGLIVTGFLFFMANTKIAKLNKIDGKEILYKGFANHKFNAEARGGFLFLTNEFLFFIPHNINLQHNQIIIYLDEITDIKRYKSLGIINNGLSISHKDLTEKFVVNNANEWIEEINRFR